MKRTLRLTMLIALAITPITRAQFFEDWDDGMGASRWSAPIVALEDPSLGFDGSVDYAFDYSVIGAASAPNSEGGTTIGVAFETNTTDNGDPGLDQGEGVGIVPLSALGNIPSGDFSLTADAYIYWNGGNGSTEYLTIGVFNTGTAVPLRFSLDAGDGLAWQFDGEGGSGTDILRFENPPGTETGLGGWEDITPGSIPGFNTGTPGVDFPGNQFAGPANRWIEVGVESVGGIVSLLVNGVAINTFDNSGGQFTAGSLMIGQSDPFNSVNPDDMNGNSNVVVFDNIRLVPEPGTGLLLILAGCFSALRWRRR